MPTLRKIDGFVDALLLSRATSDGSVEIEVLTLWDSIDAIRGFTGNDVDRAVVEPTAHAALLSYEPMAEHFEVAPCQSEPRSRFTTRSARS